MQKNCMGEPRLAFFDHDLNYMRQAYGQAERAYAAGEVPIGAIVVDSQGNVIGTGYNQVETLQCQDAHAEMLAIKNACAVKRDWRLEGCTLYVTLQPCMMCYGLSALSRIERIVYGAPSEIYGFEVDRLDEHTVYTKHTKFFSSGVMKDEIEALLKKFFKAVRG